MADPLWYCFGSAAAETAMKFSRENVKRLISYDPDAGQFTWKEGRRGGCKAGESAGCLHPEGYISITVCRVMMKGAELAWIITTDAELPEAAILIHVDGDRANCRWSNIGIEQKAPSFDFQDMIEYDPSTGLFSWRYKVSPSGRPLVGSPGFVNDQGYVRISSGGKDFQAHRMAYQAMMGRDVPGGFEIDHINGDRSDNRWSNLRVVSRTQNNMNADLRTDNKSGVKGVYFDKARGLWAAEIKAEGKRHAIGRFATIEEAAKARSEAEQLLFGEFSFSASRK